MKGIIAIAFAAVFMVAIVMGLILVYTTAQAKPLPNDPVYTWENSSVNQSSAFVYGFMTPAVGFLTPFIFVLIVFFFMAVIFFALSHARRNH